MRVVAWIGIVFGSGYALFCLLWLWNIQRWIKAHAERGEGISG
jgi:hypothetical protein